MATTGLSDTFYERNKRTFRFTITDEDNAGIPFDLTLYTSKWAITVIGTTVPILEKSLGSGITHTNPTGGILEVALDAADTDGLAADYYFELELYDGSLEGVVVATGTLTILPNVDNT